MTMARDNAGGRSAELRDLEIDSQVESGVADVKSHGSSGSNGSKSHDSEKKGDKIVVEHGNEESSIDYAAASKYNVYFQKEQKEHILITPVVSHDLERAIPPRKWKGFSVFRNELPKAAQDNTFFVHKPKISFHHPPRTLRRGPHKNSPVTCLINNSWFWRKWILQFGEALSQPGVIDPRGVVSAEFGVKKKDASGRQAKGYKVRTWRMWSETGKKYHREINERRKAGWVDPKGAQSVLGKPLIDEVLFFSWHSPFTHKTRHYCFNYAGLEFYWKGTGTVKESKLCGWWLRFNHFKLCVKVPVLATAFTPEGGGPIRRTTTWGSLLTRFGSKNEGFREVCLAVYTSSLGKKKAGTLEIYDDVLHGLLVNDVIPLDVQKKQQLNDAGVIGVKKLRLYEVILATAMCMMLGEWQKRQTIKAILKAASEAGGNA